MSEKTIDETEEITEEYNPNSSYPSLIERFQSNFIDALFIIVMMYVFSLVLDNFENAPDWVRVTLFITIWVIYDPLFTSLGATLGNLIIGLRVRQYKNHDKRISFFKALIRYIFKISLGTISFLTIHSNKQKRAIHDFIVDSVVIKKPLL
ncbi:MAG: RDD family protein [Bacteroidia bacterium]